MNETMKNKYNEALKSKNRNEKIVLLEEVIENEPDFFDAYLLLTKTYYSIGKYEQSYKTALTAHDRFKTNTDINLYLYRWFRDRSDFKSAEKILSETLKVYPDNGNVLMNYAVLLLMSGFKNFDYIKELIDKALVRDSKSDTVRFFMFQFLRLGIRTNYSEAEIIRFFNETGPDDFHTYYYLALYQFEQNQFAKGYENISTANKLLPNSRPLKNLQSEARILKAPVFKPLFILNKWINLDLLFGILFLALTVLFSAGLNKAGFITGIITILLLAYYHSVTYFKRDRNRRHFKSRAHLIPIPAGASGWKF